MVRFKERSLEEVKVHGPKALRHRGRAVTASDFEDLAFEASSQVARAKAIGARRAAEAGTVGLILVPRGEGARPTPTLALLDQVREYLLARLTPTAEPRLTGPDWLKVGVRAEVVPQRLEEATDVQNAVLARLAVFLHPLSGGLDGSGWEFGRKPHRSDLFALLESTPGVDHVRRLEVEETEEPPKAGEPLSSSFLVYSGDHEIAMEGGTDEGATV